MSQKPSAPQKPNVPASGLASGATFNTLFATLAAVDYSVDLFAAALPASRLAFLGVYYEWRESPPVLNPLLLLLLLLLPFVIFGFVKDALGALLGWRRASWIRQAADVLQAVTLIGVILPLVITQVAPIQGQIKSVCTPGLLKNSNAACLASLEQATPLHLAMLLLNLVMFSCDIAKFVGNSITPASKKKDA